MFFKLQLTRSRVKGFDAEFEFEFEKRRNILIRQFNVKCDCVRCRNPEPTIACPNKQCLYHCGTNDEKCLGCEKEIPEKHRKDYMEIRDLTRKIFDTPQNYSILSKN